MSVREYVGARYVPLFADPLEWDATSTYEPLTVVLYQGNSYTSRQAVPANIPITNTAYWAQTGNYNAQIEQYRAEVQTFDGRITANATAITAEETARQTADTALAANVATNATAISNESTARQNADTSLAADIAANTTAISNEATARQNADTVLAADVATNATAITNEETARQNADSNILQTMIGKMLVFGDSWIADASSVPVQNCWVYGVQTGLGLNGLDCYAKAGAKLSGAAMNRNSLYSQIQDAIAGIPSANRSAYKYAFIMGGINDYNANVSVSTLQTDLESAITTLQTAFPNTKIILIGPNVFFDSSIYASNTFRNYAYVMQNACVNLHITYLDHFASSFLLFGQSVFRPNDDSSYSAGGGTYHPNNSGNRRIAAWILNRMAGSLFCVPIVFSPMNGATITEQNSYADGRNLYLDLKITLPAYDTTSYKDVGVAYWDGYQQVIDMRPVSGSCAAGYIRGVNTESVLIDRHVSSWVYANYPGYLTVFSKATSDNNVCHIQGAVPLWY